VLRSAVGRDVDREEPTGALVDAAELAELSPALPKTAASRST
jgi:hypothetical protein